MEFLDGLENQKNNYSLMKYLLVCIALCISFISKAQILYDYEIGPSLNQVQEISSNNYAFEEGWFKSTPNNDHTITVVNIATGIKSNIIYLKGKSFPEFILEDISFSLLNEFIKAMCEIGFRQVSSDTWVRLNGDVLVLQDNRGKPGEVHFSHEVLAFFSLHNLQYDN